ncbi:MAG: DegT/DnrJ/EryC1/StrS family aminotransferase [Candidatus Omnitrophota bacterium]|nr:DegT/DnrJ/EryC1/StrS family aminotransferase [Candidatus Omnitrophota bacterium]
MKIPILDLQAQYKSIKNEIDAALMKVVGSQHFILGPEVEAFEREVAVYCGTKYAVGVASGTDALILSLKALGIGPGDEVITTPFTFFATAESVSILGAKPIFVDIDPKTYCINPELIEDKITKRTKAIIPVHLFGQCADMDRILEIAKINNLKVIEDTAQAMGATYKDRQAGSMGDAGALSFFPSKNLGGFGDGGMVVTNNKAIADKIKMLRVHGSTIRYIHSEIGANSRLDALQAAILRIKLKYLNKWLDGRRRAAQYYNDHLKDISAIMAPFAPSYNTHTYHLYTLRVKPSPEKLAKFLNDAGIEARTYYPVPLHLQECYKDLNYKKGAIPESESAASQTFSIPIYPELGTKELKLIVEKIIEGSK